MLSFEEFTCDPKMQEFRSKVNYKLSKVILNK